MRTSSPLVSDEDSESDHKINPLPSSRTPLLLAAIVFFLCLILTYGLWKNAQQQAQRALEVEFDFQARQIPRRIEARMATYEQVLRGVQAFLLGYPEASREDFRLYVETLRLQEKYPGIQGVAIASLVPKSALEQHVAAVRRLGFPDYSVRPAGEREVYSSVTQIEPFTELNLRAFGFDMLTNPERRAAMERARDTGEAAASAKVRLVQENGQREQAGLVMYLPLYRRALPAATVEERRANLIAWIGAPFRMDDLMAGLGDERAQDIALAIYDGDAITEQAQLYPTLDSKPAGKVHPSIFSATQRIVVAGRTWTLDMRSRQVFEQRIDSEKPLLFALCGFGASAMLALLVWILATGRRRALSLANAMTHRLRASEFRWKYALEGAGDGVWDWNHESGEIIYSKRWKAMLGYDEFEIRNNRAEWQRLVHPEDLTRASAVIQSYLAGHEPSYANEFRLRHKDGSWIWILARGMAVSRDAAGAVLRTIGTHTDITLIKQHAEALRASKDQLEVEQKRFRVILENSHDAFIAADPQGRITDWNARAETMFGWSAAEAAGRDLGELIVPAEFREAHYAGFRRFVVTGKATFITRVVQVNGQHRNGHRVPLELAVAGFPEASGYAVSAFIRDISERNEAERLEAERSRALDEAREALQHSQKLEAVGKLTGGVAHDFNNVLQVISGNIHLLRFAAGADPAQTKRLNSMMSAVDHGSKLSSQLLAFARRQPLQPLVLNLARTIGNMDDLLRRALGESIQLRVIVAENLANTLADPSPLENVILNLAINARDAMPDGGTLTMELTNVVLEKVGEIVPGPYVLLSVSDTGVGMSAEVRAQAFEPFFTTKPAGQGTGLGLSMAYGFVKQSGGQIEIDSEPGHGTTVRIYLPRSTQPEAELPVAPNEAVTGGDETILVVEDDAGVRTAVAGMLAELGYRILTAEDGESALAIIQSGVAIDLLLTDVVMPGSLPGPQLAKKAKEILPTMAVLFTSGFTRNALVSGGRLDEGVQLLSKPYRREQLAQKVRAVLGE